MTVRRSSKNQHAILVIWKILLLFWSGYLGSTSCEVPATETAPPASKYLKAFRVAINPWQSELFCDFTTWRSIPWRSKLDFLPQMNLMLTGGVNVELCTALSYQLTDAYSLRSGFGANFGLVGESAPFRKGLTFHTDLQSVQGNTCFLDIYNLCIPGLFDIPYRPMVDVGFLYTLEQKIFRIQSIAGTLEFSAPAHANPSQPYVAVGGVYANWMLNDYVSIRTHAQLYPMPKLFLTFHFQPWTSQTKPLGYHRQSTQSLYDTPTYRPKSSAAAHSSFTTRAFVASEEILELHDQLVDFLNAPANDVGKQGKLLHKKFLLTGPPGVGKTSFIRSVSQQSNAPLYQLGPKHFSASDPLKQMEGSKILENLQNTKKPALLVIEEIDRACENQFDSNLNGTLLPWLDQAPEHLVILATTNHPESLDVALTRSGRLGKILRFQPPTQSQRKSLLELYVKPEHLFQENFDWERAAENAKGLTGADIAALPAECFQRKKLVQRDLNMQDFIEMTNVFRIKHGQRHFKKSKGLESVYGNEKLKRAILSLKKRITLSDSKKALAKEWGTTATMPNILLTGATGSGKTHIALAIAAELQIPLTTIDSSTLQTKWRGEASNKLKKTIDELKNSGEPHILFIDEIHTIGTSLDKRGHLHDDELSGVLLHAFDPKHDLDPNHQLMVIAATHRKELLEAAMVRPGRCKTLEVIPVILKSQEDIKNFLLFKLKNKKAFDSKAFDPEQAALYFYTSMKKCGAQFQCTPADFDSVIENAVWVALTHPGELSPNGVDNKDFEAACDEHFLDTCEDPQIQTADWVHPGTNEQLAPIAESSIIPCFIIPTGDSHRPDLGDSRTE